jgi:uncharacterized protein with ATP-grasp and redox domains
MRLFTPNPVRSDGINAFASHTFRVRLPAIVRQIQAQHPQYPALIQRNLDQLHDDLVNNARIVMLNYPAPDADLWALEFAQRRDETWLDAQWFFAEMYFFRLIIQAVRYFETEHDPFFPFKQAEFHSPLLRQLLPVVLTESINPTPDVLHLLFSRALWGNRADLSLVLDHRADDASDADLLADDRTAVVEHILRNTGTVHLITDNAGTELAMDMVLADALLRLNIPVTMHVKMHPTYVSDATAGDVRGFIADLVAGKYDVAGDDSPTKFGQRLSQAFEEGRLCLAPDFYWNSPRWLDDVPLRLQKTFEDARLVIVKGDANYRRTIHDTIHPADIPYADYLSYFPVPLVALRTLKSDPIIGLPTGMAEQLHAQDAQWRTRGRYGVIQFRD